MTAILTIVNYGAKGFEVVLGDATFNVPYEALYELTEEPKAYVGLTGRFSIDPDELRSVLNGYGRKDVA